MTAALATSALAGCQTPSTNTSAGNTGPANVANTNAAANTATAATPAAPASTGPLTASSTPTDVYKAAYSYRKSKDIEGLKKVFSKDVLEFLSMIAKEEKKTVDDQLRELSEQPQYSTDETRNEKITGNRATIEYRDEDGDWKTMDFVKEDGMWKMSLPGGEPEGEKKGEKKQ
jgi:hypothetical protein